MAILIRSSLFFLSIKEIKCVLTYTAHDNRCVDVILTVKNPIETVLAFQLPDKMEKKKFEQNFDRKVAY